MTIPVGRTEQLDIICHITGFTSDFLSFIVVVLIRFFHGALQLHTFVLSHFRNLYVSLVKCWVLYCSVMVSIGLSLPKFTIFRLIAHLVKLST